MRLALVTGHYRPDRDGVADYVRRLAAELPAYGAEPVVAAGGRPGAASGAASGVAALCARWDLPGVTAAARRLADLDVDLVHVQFAPSAYGYSPAIGLLPLLLPDRLPVITTLHEYGWWSWPRRLPAAGWPVLERRRLWDRETLALVPRSAAVVATNEPHARLVRDRFGRRVPVRVLPIGPNVPPAGHDRATARRRLGLPATAPLLVFFGFVHPVKGVRELVDALALLPPRRPAPYVLLAGGVESLALRGRDATAFEAELHRRIAVRGVADRVRLTGWLPPADASAALSAADVVVLPFTDGVTTKSGSLLAAWEHARPVVATRATPPDPELVDGATVVLVERGRDPAALAAGLDRALADPGLRARVAAGGRAAAAARGWPVVAGGHAELYREVLRETAERRRSA